MCRRRPIIQKSQEPGGSLILEKQTSEIQAQQWLKSHLDYVSKAERRKLLQLGREGVELRMYMMGMSIFRVPERPSSI